jgi:hypothetical protein
VGDYRTSAAICPSCGVLMEERRVVEALVDVCPTCLGLWIDWFDGDIAHLTREAGSPPVYAPASGKAGEGKCPRCTVALTAEPLLSAPETERASLPPHRPPPTVYRCSDCAGAFVPRAAAEEIIALGLATAREPDAPPGVLDRLLAVLRALVGARPG